MQLDRHSSLQKELCAGVEGCVGVGVDSRQGHLLPGIPAVVTSGQGPIIMDLTSSLIPLLPIHLSSKHKSLHTISVLENPYRTLLPLCSDS